MSRMPPSFSGGFVWASADVADTANTQAKAPARIRFMKSSLGCFLCRLCPRLCIAPIMPHGQMGSKPRGDAVRHARRRYFRLAEWAFLFEHDLVRKPVPTFRDHALALGQ